MKHYTIDPFRVSLVHFLELTGDRKMPPGRQILHERMEERFRMLVATGITSLGELIRILRSTAKIASLTRTTGLPADYLTVLRKEAESYLARPFPLSQFTGIPYEYVASLSSKGLKNTRDFFEKMQTAEQRKAYTKIAGVPESRLNLLFILCDLSRITGVGPRFARILYDAGIRSVQDFAKNAGTLSASTPLREADIRYCMHYARVIVDDENILEPA